MCLDFHFSFRCLDDLRSAYHPEFHTFLSSRLPHEYFSQTIRIEQQVMVK